MVSLVQGGTGTNTVDAATAIRKVNDTLQGPVLDILCRLVPEVRALPRADAYERTLDDITLLTRCFDAFRRERGRFRALLVDGERKPVDSDSMPLSCGRTLDEIVAMVVRTAAKRYFRRRLAGKDAVHRSIAPRLRQDVRRKGFAHRLMARLAEPKEKTQAKSGGSRADELYDAIKAHLLHDWQVPMVPTYAEMTPTLIRALGVKILEVRDIEHLKRIADDPAEAAKLFDLPAEEVAVIKAPSGIKTMSGMAPPPVVEGGRHRRARLSRLLAEDGKTVRVEAFAETLAQSEVKMQLQAIGASLRHAEILGGVGGVPVKLLVAELGMRMDQLAVVLLASHAAVGPMVFGRIFGQPGDAEVIMRMTQRARAAGLGQNSSLEECRAVVADLFARFGGK